MKLGRPEGAGTNPPWLFLACLLAFAVRFSPFAFAAEPLLTPEEIAKKVKLTQKLNAQVPLELRFRDETGQQVELGRYFNEKPVMLNLIQYRCVKLCSQEMAILGDSLREMRFSVGDQFEMVTLSIDPREQPYLAAEYKEGYLKEYNRPSAAAGWHFLTGDEASIRRLADSIGYVYHYDARTDTYAHPDGVIVLTPEGRVARYFFRLRYPPRDLKFALIEAAKGRIGSPIDALALLCFHYDPLTGRYGLAVMKIVRLAGLVTVLGLGIGIGLMSLRGRQLRRHAAG